ncbi:MAG: isochorismate synthase [Deltaproteobacteria bacterium]|nr:isochorismate synthase [Deltaproteobacteria bacterium]
MSGGAALAPRVVRLDDPGDFLAIAAGAGRRPLFYFEHPARGVALLALGAVAEIRAAGPDRFAAAAAAARALFAGLPPSDPPPLLVGGFAFSDTPSTDPAWREFPALRFVLPELTWVRRGGSVHLFRGDGGAAAAPLEGAPSERWREPGPPLLRIEESRDRPRWCAAVEDARQAIARGALEKVVVARRRTLHGDAPLEPQRLLARARARRPGCTSFWIGAGETSLVGSSPEVLLRARGGRLETEALAGSAARGETAVEDERLGRRLLASAKERREHDLVLESIREALAPLARSLVAAGSPSLLRLPEAQHLHTPVRAELDGETGVLEIAGRLHPTAAVCGAPRDAARAWIDRREPDRGWYSGAVGWIDAVGDGELVVALRCGLVDGRALSLWAGAGIVEGSEAEAEFVETEAKLGALLDPPPAA